MSALEKGIRIVGTGKTYNTTITDTATGEKIDHVKAISLNLDADSRRYLVVLTLDIPFEYEGPALITDPNGGAE